jgi:hypothetical protein
MCQIVRFMLVILCAVATAQAWAAETIDYSRRINPSPGAVPEFQISAPKANAVNRALQMKARNQFVNGAEFMLS